MDWFNKKRFSDNKLEETYNNYYKFLKTNESPIFNSIAAIYENYYGMYLTINQSQKLDLDEKTEFSIKLKQQNESIDKIINLIKTIFLRSQKNIFWYTIIKELNEVENQKNLENSSNILKSILIKILSIHIKISQDFSKKEAA